MTSIKKVLPLNRVEGDLEIAVTFDSDNVVRQAQSRGTMYRGIENLLTGRGPLDGLVITPRICGICTTAHLNAAAAALDMAFKTQVPANAQRLRNVTLMVEQLQNDIRHTFLLFTPDLTHTRYAGLEMYAEALDRFQVLQGRSTIEGMQATKRVIEIIAILGGQWPHSSFMVPGGVVSLPSATDIVQCRHLLHNFSTWYQRRVLGCELTRWQAVQSLDDLFQWMNETRSHALADLGFLLRYGHAAGLDRLGGGHYSFISCGGPKMPSGTSVEHLQSGQRFLASGVYADGHVLPLEPGKITEDTACAYYRDDTAVRHPYQGRTKPDHKLNVEGRYSWAKAPRYDGRPAENGPLADMLVAGHGLFVDWVQRQGPTVLARQVARLVRPALYLPLLEQWLAEMRTCDSAFYQHYLENDHGEGYGLVPAPRGMLGHWIRIDEGKIANYQVITPTAWNASPSDTKGQRGPIEEALVGIRVQDPEHPVEIEHVVRSFDPCLVCTVHAVDLD